VTEFAREMKRLKTVRWTVSARAIRIAITSSPAQSIPANRESVLIPGILTALPAYKKAWHAPMTATVAQAGAKMENAGNSVRISRR